MNGDTLPEVVVYSGSGILDFTRALCMKALAINLPQCAFIIWQIGAV